MKKLTSNELKEILDKHNKWLANEPDGECANLSDADLRGFCLRGVQLAGANLCSADLSEVDFSYADLRCANLSCAKLSYAYLYGTGLHNAILRGANLSCANLSDANLSHASLYAANLYNADLSGANITGANLYCADLSGVKLSGANFSHADLRYATIERTLLDKVSPIACPEFGSFVGWKKCRDGLIVKLEICEDAKRSSAFGRKCRCSKAKVIEICDVEGTTQYTEAISTRDENFVYKLGEIVEVENFDEDRRNECSTGIHFFITRQEAIDYGG